MFSGSKPWSCLIKVLSDKDCDDEVTCYCLTLVNKVRNWFWTCCFWICYSSCSNVFSFHQILNAAPDQDLFYDISDSLEEQGIEQLLKVIFNKLYLIYILDTCRLSSLIFQLNNEIFHLFQNLVTTKRNHREIQEQIKVYEVHWFTTSISLIVHGHFSTSSLP